MPTFPFPTDLAQFVVWIASPAAVGVIVAYLLEKLPFWQDLPSWAPLWLIAHWPQVKSLLVFGLSLGLSPLSAWVLGLVPPEYWATGQGWVNLILQGLVIWTSSQYAHGNDPNRVYHLLKEEDL